MSKGGTDAGTVSERAFRSGYLRSLRRDRRREGVRDAMYSWIRRLYGDDHDGWLADNERRYRTSLRRARHRESEREAMYMEIRRVYGRGDDGAHLVQRVLDAHKRDQVRAKQANKQMAAVVRKVEAKRAQDTIDLLYRRGQIDGRQQLAGLSYRQWWNDCGGSMPCTLDQSRVRNSNMAGASPTMAQMLAAERLRDAARILGVMDERIVRLVVVEGRTIEEAARAVLAHGGLTSDRNVLHVGHRLRLALEMLADEWYPQGRSSLDGSDSRAEQVVQAGTVQATRVAHATLRRVHYIGD